MAALSGSEWLQALGCQPLLLVWRPCLGGGAFPQHLM